MSSKYPMSMDEAALVRSMNFLPDDFRPETDVSSDGSIDPRLLQLDSGYTSPLAWFDFDTDTSTGPMSRLLNANYQNGYYQPPMINAGAAPIPAPSNRGVDLPVTPAADTGFWEDGHLFSPLITPPRPMGAANPPSLSQWQMRAALPTPPYPSPPQQQTGAAAPPPPQPQPIAPKAPAKPKPKPKPARPTANPLSVINPTPIIKRGRGRPPKITLPSPGTFTIMLTTVDTAHQQYSAAGLQTAQYQGLKTHGVKGNRGHERQVEGLVRREGESDKEWNYRNGNSWDRDLLKKEE